MIKPSRLDRILNIGCATIFLLTLAAIAAYVFWCIRGAVPIQR